MNIKQFMLTLKNKLNENLFYNVELYKEYNKHDETYTIHVTAKREYDEYDCDFEIDKEWLDDVSINEIVNCLLND